LKEQSEFNPEVEDPAVSRRRSEPDIQINIFCPIPLKSSTASTYQFLIWASPGKILWVNKLPVKYCGISKVSHSPPSAHISHAAIVSGRACGTQGHASQVRK
jgi:hypothetical protein